MPRKKKEVVEVVLDEVVQEAVEEVLAVIEEDVVKALDIKEEPKVEEPKVEVKKPEAKPAKKAVKKIVLASGKTDIDGLRHPIGFDNKWKEDRVSIKRIRANTSIEIIIPEECDLNKWVKYYRSLSALGIKVIKFGQE